MLSANRTNGATGFSGTLGKFLICGSIWWLEKDMHVNLFIAYLTYLNLTYLNLTYVILLELCSLSP